MAEEQFDCPYGRSGECINRVYHPDSCLNGRREGFEKCPVFEYFVEMVDSGRYDGCDLAVINLRLWEGLEKKARAS